MTTVYFLCVFIVFVTYLMVVVDMFKKKVSRGFCGLFFFPLAYYHSIKYYSGNKKLVATLLFTSTLIVLIIRVIISIQTTSDLKPFNDALSGQLKMNCRINDDFYFDNGIRKYLIVCTPSMTDSSSYKDVYDMVRDYQVKYIEHILPTYKDKTHLIQDRAVIIGILSPFNVYACFEISSAGVVVNSWNSAHSAQQKPCDTHVRKIGD